MVYVELRPVSVPVRLQVGTSHAVDVSLVVNLRARQRHEPKQRHPREVRSQLGEQSHRVARRLLVLAGEAVDDEDLRLDARLHRRSHGALDLLLLGVLAHGFE